MIESERRLVDAAEATRLTEIFPEIELIEDAALRRQVLAIWARTWRLSGYADLREAVFMPHLPTRTLVDHTRAVTLAAIGIARALAQVHGMTVNMDRLIAAAILHDAAKCVEYERRPDGRWSHSELGKNYPHSFLVCELGRQLGLPEDVNHLIAAHSPTSPVVPRYLEGVILARADLADADCMHFADGQLTDRVKKGLPSGHWSHIFE